ncbi:MAG: nuclease-related domain-containing protein [Pseudohongiellaceae bacterium]
MKSPIKQKPLNNPGETLEREITEFKNEKLAGYALAITLLILLPAWEWYRWVFDPPVSPITVSVVSVVGIGFFLYRVVKLRRDLRHLYQGLAGEKTVGQLLESLRSDGATVFHDIPGSGFNLDHVVIHHSGIYVIETKTYSKPDKGKAAILYDGKSLRFPGNIERDAPLIQVTAGAKWFQEIVKESTGLAFDVRPVVVFPGWYVQSSVKASKGQTWVLNPKALMTFISSGRRALQDDQVSMVTAHVSAYIRAYKNNNPNVN